MDYELSQAIGILRWKANPVGRRPVKYRVYGSDEKGFSVSDKPYQVNVFATLTESPLLSPLDNPLTPFDKGERGEATFGLRGNQEKGKLHSPFGANFVAETTDTEIVVVGLSLTLPNTNKAYYRVVAVDQQGNRSGPSDYVEALRPFIYSTPVEEAKVGQEYRYQVTCIR